MIHKKLLRTLQHTFKMSSVPGDWGIELEVEGKNLPHVVPGWQVHAENSLRGEALEYVTEPGVTIENFPEKLSTLLSFFKSSNTELKLSHRGSTHIHMNVQQELLRDILGIIILHTILEPVLLRFCGPERDGNLFCLPALDTGDLPFWMRRVTDWCCWNGNMQFPQRGKYAALNVDHLRDFGSLEFRTFPITVEHSKLMGWLRILDNMKRCIHEHPDKTFESLFFINEIQGNILPRVFGKTEYDLSVECSRNASDLIMVGLEHAYELYVSIRPAFFFTEEYADTVRKKHHNDEDMY